MKQKFNSKIKAQLESIKLKEVALVIGMLVFSRLIPHWPNFTALGATALLAPRWLNKSKLSLLVPILALFVSDLIIGFSSQSFFTYGAIFLVSFLSWIVNEKDFPSKREKTQITQGFQLNNRAEVLKWTFSSSFIFFIITNFGVWSVLELYPKNLYGLFLSYWNGVPFFVYEFVGTIFYVYLALVLKESLSVKRLKSIFNH